MYADLHIHSCFSDGTLYPQEITRQAKSKGVSWISIADHDTLDAWDTFPAICAAEGLRALSAVELHAQWGELTCHVLAYGFDLQNESFRRFIKENRQKLDSMGDTLVKRMKANYPAISLDDYSSYTYIATRGGWKLINYLVDRGLAKDQKDAMKYYKLYNCTYGECGFLSVEQVCAQIKAAGGEPILAHPGDYIALDEGFAARLNDLREKGILGLECYYPLQDDAYTAACLEHCQHNDWIITCGSDFHGGFLPNTEICKLKVPVELLRLKGLSDRFLS